MSRRTRIKFCGLTRARDLHGALALDIDLIGFVFAASSPRRLELVAARDLRAQVPDHITTVALVMDNPAQEIDAIVEIVKPDLLQFHGRETDAFCAGFGRPFVKALAMAGRSADEVAGLVAQWPVASMVLFDGHGAGEMGGSGKVFDWDILPAHCDKPFLLAGGLHPDNVAAAIGRARPWGVDVSSGIESAPGIKDLTRMRDFVAAVRAADASPGEGPGDAPDVL